MSPKRRVEVVRCAGPFVTIVISLLALLFGGSGIFYLVAGATRWSTDSFLIIGLGVVSLAIATAVWRSFLVIAFGRLIRNPSFGLPIGASKIQRVHVDHDEIRVAINGELKRVALVKGISMDPVDCAHRVAERIQQAASHTHQVDVVVGEPHDDTSVQIASGLG